MSPPPAVTPIVGVPFPRGLYCRAPTALGYVNSHARPGPGGRGQEVPMNVRHARRVNRRSFLEGLTFAATAGLLGVKVERAAAEPPPETRRLRLTRVPSICRAPQWIAEPLLMAEGFTDVRYVRLESDERGSDMMTAAALASGQVDLSMQFIGPSIVRLDAGDPIVLLAGVQIGCYELLA